MTLAGTVAIGSDPAEATLLAARWLAGFARQHARAKDRFTIALAGGATPRPLYEALAGEPLASEIPWSLWHVYFGDERACSPDDPESNYRLASESLLDRVPIPPSHVYRMEGEAPDLDAAAADYSGLLRTSLLPGPGGAPRLDCVLLGLGADGHTASLFPGTPALDVTESFCTRGHAPSPPVDRLSLTFPVLNAATAVAYLVVGVEKAEALLGVAAGEVPASRVHPVQGQLMWFLDQAAAGRLSAKRQPLPGSL